MQAHSTSVPEKKAIINITSVSYASDGPPQKTMRFESAEAAAFFLEQLSTTTGGTVVPKNIKINETNPTELILTLRKSNQEFSLDFDHPQQPLNWFALLELSPQSFSINSEQVGYSYKNGLYKNYDAVSPDAPFTQSDKHPTFDRRYQRTNIYMKDQKEDQFQVTLKKLDPLPKLYSRPLQVDYKPELSKPEVFTEKRPVVTSEDYKIYERKEEQDYCRLYQQGEAKIGVTRLKAGRMSQEDAASAAFKAVEKIDRLDPELRKALYFVLFDRMQKKHCNSQDEGTTALLGTAWLKDNVVNIDLAFAGDSLAAMIILDENNQAYSIIPLNKPHDVNNPLEQQRVLAQHGELKPRELPQHLKYLEAILYDPKNYLNGDLEVTRGLGDLRYYNKGFSNTPEVVLVKHKLENNRKAILVMYSDGIKLTPRQLCAFFDKHPGKSEDELSNLLADYMLNIYASSGLLKNSDNILALVMRIIPIKKSGMVGDAHESKLSYRVTQEVYSEYESLINQAFTPQGAKDIFQEGELIEMFADLRQGKTDLFLAAFKAMPEKTKLYVQSLDELTKQELRIKAKESPLLTKALQNVFEKKPEDKKQIQPTTVTVPPKEKKSAIRLSKVFSVKGNLYKTLSFDTPAEALFFLAQMGLQEDGKQVQPKNLKLNDNDHSQLILTLRTSGSNYAFDLDQHQQLLNFYDLLELPPELEPSMTAPKWRSLEGAVQVGYSYGQGTSFKNKLFMSHDAVHAGAPFSGSSFDLFYQRNSVYMKDEPHTFNVNLKELEPLTQAFTRPLPEEYKKAKPPTINTDDIKKPAPTSKIDCALKIIEIKEDKETCKLLIDFPEESYATQFLTKLNAEKLTSVRKGENPKQVLCELILDSQTGEYSLPLDSKQTVDTFLALLQQQKPDESWLHPKQQDLKSQDNPTVTTHISTYQYRHSYNKETFNISRSLPDFDPPLPEGTDKENFYREKTINLHKYSELFKTGITLTIDLEAKPVALNLGMSDAIKKIRTFEYHYSTGFSLYNKPLYQFPHVKFSNLNTADLDNPTLLMQFETEAERGFFLEEMKGEAFRVNTSHNLQLFLPLKRTSSGGFQADLSNKEMATFRRLFSLDKTDQSFSREEHLKQVIKCVTGETESHLYFEKNTDLFTKSAVLKLGIPPTSPLLLPRTSVQPTTGLTLKPTG